MDQNKAAISALREYSKIKNPKYAFMIEAPWGSGKTYFVEKEFKDAIENGEARYTTLNGVKDLKEFRQALLSEIPEKRIAKSIEGFGNSIGSLAKLGNVGTIVHDIVENQLINDLPRLLIFDDIERCELSVAEILGLLNNFVEHKKKNVVICGYIERNEDAEEIKDKIRLFLTLKEKVVGRTVKIVADVDQALPDLIKPMPNGQGKKWFESNHDLVVGVFNSEKHSNLRVLRQCMHDCGRVIDILENDLLASENSMIRFVRTYLALSMAVATGKLSAHELGERNNYNCLSEPGANEDPHPLYECLSAHPQAEIFAGDSANILPLDLGVSLIGIGYEDPEQINAALRATKQFSGETETPLWQRFIKWRSMPSNELESAHEAARSYVLEQETVEPGPYLLLAHILVRIAEDGEGTGDKMARDIVDRIKKLLEVGKIPAATNGVEYGWSSESGFLFAGYNFGSDELTKPIVDAMRNAQFAAFESSMADEAKRLLASLKKNLEAFRQEFSWQDDRVNFRHTEILHMIEPSEFADVVASYLNSGDFEEIGATIMTLSDRHINSGDFPREIEWSKSVKASLDAHVEKAEPIEKSRMRSFLVSCWKFRNDVKLQVQSVPK